MKYNRINFGLDKEVKEVRKNLPHLFALLVFLIPLVSLSRAGEHQHCRIEEKNESSPSDVIKTFYELVNEKRYSEAKEYLSFEAKKRVDSFWPKIFVGGFKGMMKRATKNGSIKEIKITDEKIHNNKAEVWFSLFFEDGSKKESSKNLIIEEGKWKIFVSNHH